MANDHCGQVQRASKHIYKMSKTQVTTQGMNVGNGLKIADQVAL